MATAEDYYTDLENEIQERARVGVSMETFDELRTKLDMSSEDLRLIINIPDAAYEKAHSGTFDRDISLRLAWLQQVIEHAIKTLGDPERARRWLKARNQRLSKDFPLNRATTPEGAKDVDTLLGRIDYGIPY